MVHMSLIQILSVARTVIYLWIGIEFSNLMYLYWYGYKNHKTSPIIKALQAMFASLSGMFFFLAFVPILLELNGAVHKIAVTFFVILLIPVGIAVRMFRSESIRKQVMKLPEKRIMKHKKKYEQ